MLEISRKSNLLEQKSYRYSLQDIESPNLYPDIYNYEVVHGVSTLDLEPKESRLDWFENHNINHHPLIVYEKEGIVVGYASLSEYGRT